MGDDIGSSSVWFDFCSTNVVQLSNRKYVDSLSLNPNRCHYPLITYLKYRSEGVQKATKCAWRLGIRVSVTQRLEVFKSIT